MRRYVFVPCSILFAAMSSMAVASSRPTTPAPQTASSAGKAQVSSVAYDPTVQTQSASTEPQSLPSDATTDQSTPQPDDLALQPE